MLKPVSDPHMQESQTTENLRKAQRIISVLGVPPWNAVPSVVETYLLWQRISFPCVLSLSVSLAVRSRSAQGKEQNVQITDDRQKKRMVNTDTIGNRTLR